MKAAIEQAGYATRDVMGLKSQPAARIPAWWSVVVNGALMLPMVLPMLPQLFGIDWMPGGLLELALTAPVQFWLGWRF